MGENETENQHGPNTQMNHDIRCIEDIVPVRNMLDIDEVDYATVNKPIQNITGATSDHETKTDILITQ